MKIEKHTKELGRELLGINSMDALLSLSARLTEKERKDLRKEAMARIKNGEDAQLLEPLILSLLLIPSERIGNNSGSTRGEYIAF